MSGLSFNDRESSVTQYASESRVSTPNQSNIAAKFLPEHSPDENDIHGCRYPLKGDSIQKWHNALHIENEVPYYDPRSWVWKSKPGATFAVVIDEPLKEFRPFLAEKAATRQNARVVKHEKQVPPNLVGYKWMALNACRVIDTQPLPLNSLNIANTPGSKHSGESFEGIQLNRSNPNIAIMAENPHTRPIAEVDSDNDGPNMPPKKRRRTNVILDSDDDMEDATGNDTVMQNDIMEDATENDTVMQGDIIEGGDNTETSDGEKKKQQGAYTGPSALLWLLSIRDTRLAAEKKASGADAKTPSDESDSGEQLDADDQAEDGDELHTVNVSGANADLLSMRGPRPNESDGFPFEPLSSSTNHFKTYENRVHSLNDSFNADSFNNGPDYSFPPLSDLQEIFLHMARSGLHKMPNLILAIDQLKNRKLRIATMCSGTESPVTALKIILDNLNKELSLNPTLEFDHVFSAEIVPFKQAFIELNFAPKLLFRDIIEMAGSVDNQATTAFGAKKPIPGDIDILVAGFSCVDMSNLNRKKLSLEEKGESGDTFHALVTFSQKHRPKIIILENVDGAPWEPNKKTKTGHSISEGMFNAGYYCQHIRVDTKDFYLPHTRVRGYMICIEIKSIKINPFHTGNEGPHPKKFVKVPKDKKLAGLELSKLTRAASEPVEAFLLPETDKRVLQVVNDKSQSRGSLRSVNWGTCEASHTTFRQVIGIGKHKPLTFWTLGGSCRPHNSISPIWIIDTVERVKDSIDIQYLRNLRRGFDPLYKNRIIDLSQNIDRRSMDIGASGVTGCITPSGMPWSSVLGRVLIAEEALKLQGMDPDTINVSLLSQTQLRDLAGNAMSCPTVGAVILTALSISYPAIPKHSLIEVLTEQGKSDIIVTVDSHRPQLTINFESVESIESESFFADVHNSLRNCSCEGQFGVSAKKFVVCEDCGHKACEVHSANPIHNYKTTAPQNRLDPKYVISALEKALPKSLALSLDGASVFKQLSLLWKNVEPDRPLISKSGPKIKGVKKAKETTQATLNFSKHPSYTSLQVLEKILIGLDNSEAHFVTIDRTANLYRVSFESRDHQIGSFSLELDIFGDGFEWKVFAKTPKDQPNNSALRGLLEYPIARMHPRKNMDLLDGIWELRLPTAEKFGITIQGVGNCVPSFESTRGIISFTKVTIWDKLQIQVQGRSALIDGYDIDGIYTLFQECGAPMGVLYKKESTAKLPVFLILDSSRYGHPDEDGYVFCTDLSPLKFREVRYPLARLDKNWRPNSGARDHSVDPITLNKKGVVKVFKELRQDWEYQSTTLNEPVKVDCIIDASWCSLKASLSTNSQGSYTCLSTVQDLEYTIAATASQSKSCYEAVETMSLDVIVNNINIKDTDWCMVPEKEINKFLMNLSWLKDRTPLKGDLQLNLWHKVYISFEGCDTCATTVPQVKWRLEPRKWRPSEIAKAKTSKYRNIPQLSDKDEDKSLVAYEDPEGGVNYEKAIKSRPSPFVVEYSMSNGNHLRLKIGVNVQTLIHRAASQLSISGSPKTEFSYRFTADLNHLEAPRFGPFLLPNCQDNIAVPNPPNFAVKLFDHQAKSLSWMINQEDPGVIFPEERVVEATLDELNWRAEGRVSREVLVRGGILADQVGYGKTALVLGLYDTQYQKQPKITVKHANGKVNLKATLILVPNHLVVQWEKEVAKFLKSTYVVLVIQDAQHWNSLSISNFMNADLIICPWTLLGDETYLEKVAFFAGMLPFPAGAGTRAEKSWYNAARDALITFAKTLISSGSGAAMGLLATAFVENCMEADSNRANKPSFRLKGAARRKYQEALQAQNSNATIDIPIDKDFVRKEFVKRHSTALNFVNCIDDLKGPPLELFNFHRKVVDEYTYVPDLQKDTMANISSVCSWYLSGTPGLNDFADVCVLMKLLGIDLGQPVLMPGAISAQNIKKISGEQTQSEKFRALLHTPSIAWCKDRHDYAQMAISSFVRHNKSPIEKYPVYKHIRPVELPVVDRAIYGELTYTVAASDMREKKPLKALHQLDREQRLMIIWAKDKSTGLGTSTVAALMKCNLVSTNLNLGRLLTKRKNQLQEAKSNIVDALKTARYLWIIAEDKNKKFFSDFYNRVKDNDIGDRDVSRFILRWIELHEIDSANFTPRDLKAPPFPLIKVRGKPTLRVVCNKLAELSKVLVAAVRGWRFLSSVDILVNGKATPQYLEGCVSPEDAGIEEEASINNDKKIRSEIFPPTSQEAEPNDEHASAVVFVECGHLHCQNCLDENRTQGNYTCMRKHCQAPSGYSYPLAKEIFSVGALQNGENAKMTEIVKLIKAIPKEDQILLFTQFPDQLRNITTFLESRGVSHVSLDTAREKDVGKILDEFREDYRKNSQLGQQVLLLSIDNVSAAGSNLTVANHVIFIFPYLANSQTKYESAMTQAIGRVCRHGQEKEIHVYNFLTLNTVDVDVFEARHKSILVNDNDVLETHEVYNTGEVHKKVFNPKEFDNPDHPPAFGTWEPSGFRLVEKVRFPTIGVEKAEKTTGRYSSDIHNAVVRCMDASLERSGAMDTADDDSAEEGDDEDNDEEEADEEEEDDD